MSSEQSVKGYLHKLSAGRGRKRFQQRFFVLQDNHFYYYQKEINYGRNEMPKSDIALDQCVIDIPQEWDEIPFEKPEQKAACFQIKPKSGRTYILLASSKEDLDYWLEALRAASDESQNQKTRTKRGKSCKLPETQEKEPVLRVTRSITCGTIPAKNLTIPTSADKAGNTTDDEQFSDIEFEDDEQEEPSNAQTTYVLPDRLFDYFFVLTPEIPGYTDLFEDSQKSKKKKIGKTLSASEYSVSYEPSISARDSDDDEPKPSDPRMSRSRSASESRLFSVNFKATLNVNTVELKSRYPLKDHDGLPLDPAWFSFAFPISSELKLMKDPQPLKHHFCVLTSTDRKRTIKLYAAFLNFCEPYSYAENDGDQLVYLPKSLCIVSHYPQFALFRTILVHLLANGLRPSDVPVERYISHLCQEVAVPTGNTLIQFSLGYAPIKCSFPLVANPLTSAVPLSTLFGLLRVENIVEALIVFSNEGRVLVLSKSLSLLTIACQSFLQMLYPFEWNAIYISCLTEQTLPAVGVLGPFLLGMRSDFLCDVEDDLEDVLLVDLDLDSCRYTSSETEKSIVKPTLELSLLKNNLNKIVQKNTARHDIVELPMVGEEVIDTGPTLPSDFDQEVIFAMLKFYQRLLSGYRTFVFNTDQGPTINMQEFVKTKNPEQVNFLEMFLQSQLFSGFMDRDNEYTDSKMKVYHNLIASTPDSVVSHKVIKEITKIFAGDELKVHVFEPPTGDGKHRAMSKDREKKNPNKFPVLVKAKFQESRLKERANLSDNDRFVAYKRILRSTRNQEDEKILQNMVDLFNGRLMTEKTFKFLLRYCLTKFQAVVSITNQSMNKSRSRAFGFCLSPYSITILCHILRFVMYVCEGRFHQLHNSESDRKQKLGIAKQLGIVFTASQFYYCYDLGKVDAKATEKNNRKSGKKGKKTQRCTRGEPEKKRFEREQLTTVNNVTSTDCSKTNILSSEKTKKVKAMWLTVICLAIDDEVKKKNLPMIPPFVPVLRADPRKGRSSHAQSSTVTSSPKAASRSATITEKMDTIIIETPAASNTNLSDAASDSDTKVDTTDNTSTNTTVEMTDSTNETISPLDTPLAVPLPELTVEEREARNKIVDATLQLFFRRMIDLKTHQGTIKYCITETSERYGFPEQGTKELIQIVTQLSNQRLATPNKAIKTNKHQRGLPPGTIWFAQEIASGESEPQALSSEECNKATQYLTGFMTVTVTMVSAVKKRKHKWKDAWCILTNKELWWSEADKDSLVGRMSLREVINVKHYRSSTGMIVIRSTRNLRQSVELQFSTASIKSKMAAKQDKKMKMICMDEWAKWLKVIGMMNKYPAEFPKRLKPHPNRSVAGGSTTTTPVTKNRKM